MMKPNTISNLLVVEVKVEKFVDQEKKLFAVLVNASMDSLSKNYAEVMVQE